MSNFKYYPFFQPDFELPIYCNSAYLSKISNNYGWVIDEHNKLGIPIIIKSKLLFKIVIPYGSVYDVTNNTICNSSEKLNVFYENLIDFFKKELNIDAILPSPAYVITPIVPYKTNFASFGTLRIDLFQSVEVLWDNLHHKHRNSVRMAEKLNCDFIVDNNLLDEAIQIINKTHIREKITLVNRKIFTNNSSFKVIAVTNENSIQSVAIYLFSNEGAYYLYGSNADKHINGSMNFLHWNALLYFKELNVKNYDFVGVRIGEDISEKYITLRRFKSRFGGSLVEGYMWKIELSLRFKIVKYLIKSFNFILGKKTFDLVDSINLKQKQ